MGRGTRRLVVAAAVAALALPAVGAARADTTWWWTAKHAADVLVADGVSWPGGRRDPVTRSTCTPFGISMGPTQRNLFRHFYCTVDTARGRYSVLVAPVSKTGFTALYDGYRPTRWYWTASQVTGAFLRDGLRWPGGRLPVTNDACTAFGPSYRDTYQSFECDLATPGGNGWIVVAHVVDATTYASVFVGRNVGEEVGSSTLPNAAASADGYGIGTLQLTLWTRDWGNQQLFGNPFPPSSAAVNP